MPDTTRIPILMYHSLDTTGSVVSVAPSLFEEQMACLAERGIQGASLRQAIAHRTVHGIWPERTVVITFDDGYANSCESGLPVLQRFGFSATIFVVSSHMGRRNDWAFPPPRLGSHAILSAQQGRELVAAGIEIGSHTRSHADLRRLDARQAEEEIVGSRDQLAHDLATPVESFAYPFGHLSAAAIAVVQRTFRAACTTMLRRAGADPLHELPRVDMYYVRSRAALERLFDGQLDAYLTVRRWGRALRSLAPGD